ncbi:MAG: homocysteine S-methyltransferase family protein [Oscillospiraceae bacterium]|jgi:5-methyltetrahydrofolate--homocysteine methyltransferase|nr:homocysteine S-methyltransferase family protein [Oscillospiraceae bacterium]
MTSIVSQLGRRMLICDGAMGTMLQQAGLAAGEVPEYWNFTHPEELTKIHTAYAQAGADILTANTFGANSVKLTDTEYSVIETISRGIQLAKAVAAPLGKWAALDIGPTGRLLQPLGDLSFDDAYRAFAQAAKAGEDAGADLILIETMSDTMEMKAALLACKENTSLPVFATMTFDAKGKLLTGGDIPAAAVLLESLHADAVGFNCGLGPKQMIDFLPKLREYTSLPILIQPNAGLPQVENGKTVFCVGPEEFAEDAEKLWQGGAWILGGCCGTTPAHIRALTQKMSGKVPKPLPKNERTMISSYSHAVTFGGQTKLIGERINPTGKKRLQKALRDNDMDYLFREGIAQQDAGADILDVNVGLPEINEPKLLTEAVQGLQGICDLPLQIDTSSPQAMEQALRIYNGKALLNSVNGKQEVMDSVFPLVKKYGCAVIALTLDESGIPDTAEGRLAVAEKIVREAEKYGIPKKDIIVDTLAMTISASQQSAKVTLQALRLVREKLGLHTSLGVSNISFGLPHRERATAAFFTMAMQAGLSAAIINPKSAAIMDAWRSFNALMCYDENCMRYIDFYKDLPKDSVPKAATPTGTPLQQAAQALIAAGNALSAAAGDTGFPTQAAQPTADAAEKPADTDHRETELYHAVAKGLQEGSRTAAAESLKTSPPLEVIQNELIPALDKVGTGYEDGSLFLPQLLMSADAATAAFEVIRTVMQQQGGGDDKKGTIVLATVQGDIHDIGKNIVKVLLENYGYEVIDLGRDVPPETISEAVAEHHAPLCGLSALMTTTVVNMEKTIALLHEECPWCKVMVGGAVLTQEYADQIHADRYCKDAMGSVRYAATVFDAEK